ncbi:fatty acid--CoA ligase family protein [Actinoallomurus sp. NPDC050550]|uniref:class I adenylate-forming enzyme family protein n=1 Tax=Actinoallomurus sp. NPDC050550 TaxID=3154937 RepID=UPI0033F22A86
MLTGAWRVRDRSGAGPAVRCRTSGGAWAETSWGELTDNASAAAARARALPGPGPVVLVLDGSAASIATMLGILDAGVDVLLLEENSSALADPRSPVRRLGAQVVVGPPGTAHELPGVPVESHEEFRAVPGPETAVPSGREPEVLQLTSGSTGRPRIARQTLPNVTVGGLLYRQLFEVGAGDAVLVAVPPAHSYGLAGVYAALLSGATLVTLSRFTPGAVVEAVRGGATHMLGTPLLYQLLAPVFAARGPGLRLRTALSAGGPMPASTAEDIAAALGFPVRLIYGTTEAGLIACVPQEVERWPAGSAGSAAPGVTLRLDGDGDTGRLSVRTPMMFRGYWGEDPPAPAGDGFYDTGDLAQVDPDGHVFVLGRKDGLVNVGGRKVGLARVEAALGEHPGVREAFVYAVDRADGEQEMHAAVVLAPGTGAGDVLAFCRSGPLRPYEVPHRVHALSALPRTGMGKVDRQAVLAATGQPSTPTRTGART